MRSFDHPNMVGFLCPICETRADRPVVLVPIPGTECDGIVEAKQVHVDCYRRVCAIQGIECEIKEEPN